MVSGREVGGDWGYGGQTLKDEVARGRGQFCGAVMFDFVKAYEMVKLELVWEHGRAKGFPGRIMRLVLDCFAFARHLAFKGVVAEGVDTLSARLAGSVEALDGGDGPREVIKLFLEQRPQMKGSDGEGHYLMVDILRN